MAMSDERRPAKPAYPGRPQGRLQVGRHPCALKSPSYKGLNGSPKHCHARGRKDMGQGSKKLCQLRNCDTKQNTETRFAQLDGALHLQTTTCRLDTLRLERCTVP